MALIERAESRSTHPEPGNNFRTLLLRGDMDVWEHGKTFVVVQPLPMGGAWFAFYAGTLSDILAWYDAFVANAPALGVKWCGFSGRRGWSRLRPGFRPCVYGWYREL